MYVRVYRNGIVVFSGVAVHLFVNYELFIYVHAFNSPYYK